MGRGSVSVNESVFTVAGTPLVFGPGCSLETGWHLRRAGVTRALVVTDPHLASIGLIDPVVEAIRAAGVEAEVFAGSGVEPSETTVTLAVEAAREGGFDGFVGLGGGSSIDTAKIAALLSTHPGGIYDYLNPPIGKGTPVPGPLLPLFGVPTTGGTGAEATTVAIIDLPEHHVKTGISHAHLRPLLGIVDPDLTLTTPRAVTASVGLDVLCHAIESYTAIAYDARPRAAIAGQAAALPGRESGLGRVERAGDRAGRRGAARSRSPTAPITRRAARWRFAASAAGRAFGQAGVHIPHACSYPVAGLKHEWKPPGYPGEERFVPHGFAVVLTAPASFRFTEPAAPERHRRAAELLTGRARRRGRPRRAAARLRAAHARRRRARRAARDRLRRGRSARARRRCAQAAAPARVRALRGADSDLEAILRASL